MHPDTGGILARPLGPAFDELKAFIVNTTGHVRLGERDDLLLEKISRRIGAHGLGSLESYLDLLKRDARGKLEFDCLIAELTVGETSFFRHQEQFDALRDHVLPACLRRKSSAKQLRIWSAGCANGAEAYSIAIMVHALLGERLADWTVAIVGSDINRTFLAEAERGCYSAWTLRDVADDLRPAFFTREDDGWAIRERYRRNVRFVYHNLVSDEFPCFQKNIFSFDLVMCRNVMIYFDAANNRQLAERLGAVLVEDGWLFTGPADFNPHLETAFVLEKQGTALLYRHRPPPAPTRAPAFAAPATPPASTSTAASHLAPRATIAPARKRRAPIAPAAPEPRPDIAAIVELADRGDWGAAAQYCEAFLKADSCNAPAHYYYALVQQYSGSAAAAEQALKRAIYLDRDFALAHYQLGLMHKDARDRAGGGRSFRNVLDALRDVPDDTPVSPCGQVTALDLRELATRQLALLARQAVQPA